MRTTPQPSQTKQPSREKINQHRNEEPVNGTNLRFVETGVDESVDRIQKKREVVHNMVKIRMMRMGSKKRPFYRLMAIDERKQRDGRPLEFLGTYDPRINPPAVKLNLEGIDGWIEKGAQLSGTVRSLVNGVRRAGNTETAGASTN